MDRALASGPIVWLGIILTTCLLLVISQTMLWLVLPLLLAVVLYYILSPLVNIAISRGFTRSRAVLMVTVLLSLALVILGIAVGPKIVMATQGGDAKIQGYIHAGSYLIDAAKTTLAQHHIPLFTRPAIPVRSVGVVGGDITPPPPEDDLSHQMSLLVDKYSGDVALELVHWVPSVLLIPYLTYFFLLDGPRFKRFLVRAIPNAFFEKTLYLFYRVEDQLRRYFQGLMLLTLLDALCLGIGLWFLGIHSPFFLAGLAAVMAWLPYLGSIAGCLLVVLQAAHQIYPAGMTATSEIAPGVNTWLPYEVVGLFIAVRLLDDFVFLPLTVGRSLEMHPLVTVLMILLGGAVAGISGLLLVMPVLGVVMVAGQIIGELVTDERILARHRHAKELRRLRAKDGL